MGKDVKRGKGILTSTGRVLDLVRNETMWRTGRWRRQVKETALTHDTKATVVSPKEALHEREQRIAKAREARKASKLGKQRSLPLRVTATRVGRTTRLLAEPDQKVIASRPENRLCDVCNQYFHKTRIDAHRLKAHGLASDSYQEAAVSISGQPPAAKMPTVKPPKQPGSVASARPQKSSTKKTTKKKRRDWVGGQPQYEGGFRWLQGGSPGLGKRN